MPAEYHRDNDEGDSRSQDHQQRVADDGELKAIRSERLDLILRLAARDRERKQAMERIEGLEQTVEKQGDFPKQILELKGDLKYVVFVVDMSGSMDPEKGGRWKQSQQLITNWLQHLPVENAALVLFNNQVQVLPRSGEFLSMTNKNNRVSLVKPLEQLKPKGGTATLDAIKRAYDYADVDTIVLFTDGRPVDSDLQTTTEDLVNEILDFVKDKRDRKVVINTVGLGDYFKDVAPSRNGSQPHMSQTFRLLVELATLTEGSFRAR